MTKTSVSLVLGSGGARGMAHIGVIRWLEQNNYTIRSISGCSVGALIGGIYARGKLDDYEDWVCAISKFDIINLLDVAWGKQGLVEGERIIAALTELVGDCQIEELPVKYTAIASDIANEKEVWLNSGSLFAAIRASISLPLFFAPYDLDGVQLLDGGILNPVPTEPTANDTTDLTIAVNLGAPPVGKIQPAIQEDLTELEHSSNRSDSEETKKETPTDKFQAMIGQFIDSFKNTDSNDNTGSWSMLDIADQTFDAMQATIARQKLANHPPDHIINIPRDACGTLEFDQGAEMIALGFSAANKALAHT